MKCHKNKTLDQKNSAEESLDKATTQIIFLPVTQGMRVIVLIPIQCGTWVPQGLAGAEGGW